MFKNFFKEFRTFAMRGNVIDMAIGIIIGGAFGKIVDTLVKDVMMPPLGLLLGKTDFSNLFITLSNPVPGTKYASLAAAQQAGAVTLNYGLFINSLITFIIVAFAVFLLIKTINKLQTAKDKETPVIAPTTKECPFCFSKISLKATRCPNCTSEIKADKTVEKTEKATVTKNKKS